MTDKETEQADAPAHPDVVAREIVVFARSRGYEICPDHGLVLNSTRPVLNGLATYRYAGAA
jgi:hypothetical protein